MGRAGWRAGGRIVAVGRTPASGPQSAVEAVIELRGSTVTPGFQDAHVHPARWTRVLRRPARGTRVGTGYDKIEA